jgi:hypothetical protein
MGINVRVKRRAVTTLLAFTSAVLLVISGAGTANASINWTGEVLFNNASGNASCALDNRGYPDMGSCNDIGNGSMNGDIGGWTLASEWPDTGYANVWIRNKYNDECLATTSSPGPLAGSLALAFEPCSSSNPNEEWAMTTARTPNGSEHFINFFAFAGRVCLDGGIGLYGFREEGCNPNNNWQVWDIWH